ncbi:MAG TPA: hypothetical protein VF678_05475 [bacterium]
MTPQSRDAPAQDLERVRALLNAAREHAQAQRWPQAEQAALEAQTLDPNNPKAPELLAEAARAQGRAGDAERHTAQAKHLRDLAWKRAVEAEARGQHEVIGEATRRELP